MPEAWTLALAAAVASVHIVAERLRHLSYRPRSRWLSFAGGVPLAFVFLELLPALAEGERAMGREEGALRYVPYVVALGGFALYYGAEHAARRHADPDGGTPTAVFAFSIASFALLNAVAGYLLVEEERALPATLLFAAALALKLFVADRGLYEHHRHAYDRVGRWVLLAAFAAGALVAYIGAVPEARLHMLQAFLAGGLILNVVKEELPGEKEARWSAFAAGAALYAALYLAARALEAS